MARPQQPDPVADRLLENCRSGAAPFPKASGDPASAVGKPPTYGKDHTNASI